MEPSGDLLHFAPSKPETIKGQERGNKELTKRAAITVKKGKEKEMKEIKSVTI